MAKTTKINKFTLQPKSIKVDSTKGTVTINNHELSNALVHYGPEVVKTLGINIHDINIDSNGRVVIYNSNFASINCKNGPDRAEAAWDICCTGCGCAAVPGSKKSG
jgi:hypothetical protein